MEAPLRHSPLAPGDTAPVFTLTTAYGVEVGLVPMLARGAALVEFLRGSHNPKSRDRLAEIARRHDELRQSGTHVVAIVCERPEPLRKWLDAHPLPFPVAVDVDRAAARVYGVWQRFALPIGNVARPSSFLVDRCGFGRFAYLGRLQIHVADLSEIIAVANGLDDPGGLADAP